MKKILPLLIVIAFVPACSNTDDDQLIRTASWNIQHVEDEQFNRELYARIINPDYQFSLFADYIDGNNRINSFLYSANGKAFLFKKGVGAEFHKSFVFPISNNTISEFGYEFIIKSDKINQINIIEVDELNNTYLVLYTVYSDFEFSENTGKSSIAEKNDEESLDEKTTEAIATFKQAFLNLFMDANERKVLEENLKNIPENIKKNLSNWGDRINDLKDDIKQSLEDLFTYLFRDNDENVTQEPIDKTDVTPMETTVEDYIEDDNEFYMSNYIYIENQLYTFGNDVVKQICDYPNDPNKEYGVAFLINNEGNGCNSTFEYPNIYANSFKHAFSMKFVIPIQNDQIVFDTSLRLEVTHRDFQLLPFYTYENTKEGLFFPNYLGFTYYNDNAKYVRYDKVKSRVEFNVTANYMQYDNSGYEIGVKLIEVSGRFTEFIDN